jgi:hypothetical protein
MELMTPTPVGAQEVPASLPVPAIASPTDRLEEIAQQIESVQATADFMIAKLLADAQELFRYQRNKRGFISWVEKRLTISQSEVYRLLQAHARFGGSESFPNWETLAPALPRSAIYLLACPSTPDEVCREVGARVAAGEKLPLATIADLINTKSKSAAATATGQSGGNGAAAGDTEEDPSIAERGNGADHGDAGDIDGGDRVDGDAEDYNGDDRDDDDHDRRRFKSALAIIHCACTLPDELDGLIVPALTAEKRGEALDMLAECMNALRAIVEKITGEPNTETGDAGGAAPDGHFEYLCNPAVSEFFSQAGGGDIFAWIPAERRDEVCRGFLDRLTAAGMCKVMSDEFGRQLRARLPAPKRNEQLEIGPYSNTSVDTILPDDGSIPPFLRRTGLTDADKKAIAEIENREAERKRRESMNRIAKLKAKQSGALRKMPVQGKDALALINADEAAS